MCKPPPHFTSNYDIQGQTSKQTVETLMPVNGAVDPLKSAGLCYSLIYVFEVVFLM